MTALRCEAIEFSESFEGAHVVSFAGLISRVLAASPRDIVSQGGRQSVLRFRETCCVLLRTSGGVIMTTR
jgi:hypothetical protein